MSDFEKQVQKTHYDFDRYLTKHRWVSLWHQLDEIQKLQPENALEIGPGPGLFKEISSHFGINIETFDIDPELAPDHVGSVLEMPFDDGHFDTVCAFQMLEHLPYEKSLNAFSEMARVAKKNVVISLPDAQKTWRLDIKLPLLGKHRWIVNRTGKPLKAHVFDGEHHWEINKKGFALAKIEEDFGRIAKLCRTYRVFENPYHRFFIFEK